MDLLQYWYLRLTSRWRWCRTGRAACLWDKRKADETHEWWKMMCNDGFCRVSGLKRPGFAILLRLTLLVWCHRHPAEKKKQKGKTVATSKSLICLCADLIESPCFIQIQQIQLKTKYLKWSSKATPRPHRRFQRLAGLLMCSRFKVSLS